MTREEAIKVLKSIKTFYIDIPIGEDFRTAIDLAIESLSADTVPKGVLEQFRWERDVAMMQLGEYGIPFCTNKDEDIVKVVRCKDCIHWKADNEVFELGFCCVFPQKWVAETFYCADGERREE